jgi:hypothetical protein
VAQCGRALEYASVELKADREVVLVAVAQLAVAQYNDALRCASVELQGDQEALCEEVRSVSHRYAVSLATLRCVWD